MAHSFSVYLFIFLHNVFTVLIFRQHMENEEWQSYISLDASCCPPNNELSFQKEFILLSIFHKEICRTVHVVSLLGHFYEPHVILFIMALEFHLRAVCSCGQNTRPRLRKHRLIPYHLLAFIPSNYVKDIFISLPINFSHYYFEKGEFCHIL